MKKILVDENQFQILSNLTWQKAMKSWRRFDGREALEVFAAENRILLF